MIDDKLVLIVDDDSDWTDVFGVGLSKMGYHVETKPDTTSAKAWLATGRPILILLDVMMPDGNGLDLCRWIRGQQALTHIPIIINSAIKDEETAELALELGAVDFLRKPFKMDMLKEKISRLLALKTRPQ